MLIEFENVAVVMPSLMKLFGEKMFNSEPFKFFFRTIQTEIDGRNPDDQVNTK